MGGGGMGGWGGPGAAAEAAPPYFNVVTLIANTFSLFQGLRNEELSSAVEKNTSATWKDWLPRRGSPRWLWNAARLQEMK